MSHGTEVRSNTTKVIKIDIWIVYRGQLPTRKVFLVAPVRVR